MRGDIRFLRAYNRLLTAKERAFNRALDRIRHENLTFKFALPADLPDGYEYYIWYHAYVGWMEDGKLKRLEGERFRLDDIAVGTKITPEGVIFERDGAEQLVPSELVGYAGGMRANDALAKKLREEFPVFFQVGDCRKAATVYEGIRAAYYAALDI